MNFWFCETCGKRLTEKDLEDGAARNKKLKGVFCEKCSVGVITMEMDPVNIEQCAKERPKAPPLHASPHESAAPPRKRSEIIRVKEISPRRFSGKARGLVDGSASAGQSSPPVRKRDSRPLLLGIGAATVFGGVIAFVILRNRTTPPDHSSQAPLPSKAPSVQAEQPLLPVANKSALPAVAATVQPASEKIAETPKTEVSVKTTVVNELLANELSLDLGGDIKLDLVSIPAGEFEMGSSDDASEKPIHKVKISRQFYMGKYDVTQAQYEVVMGKNPSVFKGASLPVETVSFVEVEEFCKKASKLTSKPLRLPTEAEWEYACRAGTKMKFYSGDNDAALAQAGWFNGNAEGKTHPVGQKKPNAWGLYDMHGNVWQWCQDGYVENYMNAAAEDPLCSAGNGSRVLRGGSWNSAPSDCRAARRTYDGPIDRRFNFFGFRVVLACTQTGF
jgi:formylglycine-generating enzyme required for sulfatase activity